MRYLLVIILIAFTGCATTGATAYDKKQNAVMKLSVHKYTELVKRYLAMQKKMDELKSKLSFLNRFSWRILSYVRTLDYNSNKAFALAVKNNLSVLHALNELEKLKKTLRRRGILKK